MKYKLLALDIDETVTTESSAGVSKPVYAALHAAAEHVTISFVTARAINQFERFIANLDLPSGYHVVENGAKVLNPQGSIEYDLTLHHDEVQEILDATRPYFLETGFLSDEHWRDEEFTFDAEKTLSGLSFTCVSEDQARLLQQAVKELPHEYAFYVGSHWMNPQGEWKGVLLFHKDATKGKGMRYIQEKLGITKEETIAAGDGATDITMFDQAGLKVTLENGEQVMKDAADYIAPSVHDEGIVEVIEKLILTK